MGLIRELRTYKANNVSDTDIMAVTGLQGAVVKIFSKFDELFNDECKHKLEQLKKDLEISFFEIDKKYQKLLIKYNSNFSKDRVKEKSILENKNKELQKKIDSLSSSIQNKELLELKETLKEVNKYFNVLKKEYKKLESEYDICKNDLVNKRQELRDYKKKIPLVVKFFIKDEV